MTEDFLHFIWRTRNFNFKNLFTTDGHSVEILDFGQWNTNAGPDFLMARLIIDGTEWAGNIEMHLSASEWNRHGHTNDPAFESVILHVVLEEDTPVHAGTHRLACVELKDRIDSKLLGQYLRLMATESWVPCAMHLRNIPFITRTLWLDRMLVERIQSRVSDVNALLDETKDSWEEVFYRSLASAYGFKVNSAPFARLARLLPLKVLFKHQSSSLQLEALLFGTAGMLNRIFIEEYPVSLQKEYVHLSQKYDLSPIDARAWKWGRLRPANFPTIRLAQFASLMSTFQGLFRTILESPKVDTLRNLFMTQVNPYWNMHSDFDRSARLAQRQIGMQSVDGILINTVIPFLFSYGKRRGEDQFVVRALDLICSLPSEMNTITRHWSEIDMPNLHAGHSQALIHLKNEYCDQRRCVACAIGNHILTSTVKS